MAEFKPSKKSRSPAGDAIATLQYLRKAAEAIETRLKKDDDVPPWVQQKIRESAQNLGMAVSYLHHRNGQEKG